MLGLPYIESIYWNGKSGIISLENLRGIIKIKGIVVLDIDYKIIQKHRIICSLSCKDDLYENVSAETFFITSKCEMLYYKKIFYLYTMLTLLFSGSLKSFITRKKAIEI